MSYDSIKSLFLLNNGNVKLYDKVNGCLIAPLIRTGKHSPNADNSLETIFFLLFFLLSQPKLKQLNFHNTKKYRKNELKIIVVIKTNEINKLSECKGRKNDCSENCQ